jgi:acyl-CoA synthetase (AMP-forming)/AMP-acid ligase II
MIAGLPGAAEAAVVPFAAGPGETELAAYVVVRDRDLGPSDIRSGLQGCLPAAAIPSSVLVLEALPRPRNGGIGFKQRDWHHAGFWQRRNSAAGQPPGPILPVAAVRTPVSG